MNESASPSRGVAIADAESARVPPVLTTARLVLRRARDGDAERVFAGWAQDPDVTKYLVWTPHQGLDDSRAHVARCDAAWENGTTYTWFLEDRETAALVGSIAARPGVHGVNIGYVLARPYWGRGLMREAVNAVAEWFLARPDVFRVWATCDVDNTRSARVLERCGFQLEGTLRRWDHHPNVSADPRDALCFSRTR